MTKQSLGICLLLVFWIVCWFFPSLLRGVAHNDKQTTLSLLEPMTVPEKILLGQPLNINKLSKRDLEFLPGVGPSVAKRIIEYRATHGPFQNIVSLLNVKGIGEKTLERFAPFF